MRESDFAAFERQLVRDGVALSIARRMTDELRDHHEDLSADLMQAGVSAADVDQQADNALGSLDVLAEAVASRPELRSLFRRYPLIGCAVLPLACAVAGSTGVLANANQRITPAVARWSCFASISAAITAAMMLAMQLSISLT